MQVPQVARKNNGFTLIELLIAVALSALLLVTVYSTYFSIARTIDTTLQSQELLETGRVLLEMVKRDIRGVRGGQFPLIGKLQEIDGKSVTNIEFVTSSRSSTNSFTWSKVAYALIEDEHGEKVLIKKEARNPKDDINQFGKVFEVSRIVSSFQLNFFDGTQWVDEWDSRSTGKLPKQVRIVVEISNGKENSTTFTAEEGIPTAL
jgi:general secretion pathway protein J